MNDGNWNLRLRICFGIVSLLVASCRSSHGSTPEATTAHVLPLQRISLAGILDDDTTGGFLRYEAAHFAYEVPVSDSEPATAMAPLFLTSEGTFGSGTVHVSWVPTESPEGGVIFKSRADAPARRADAVDLDLDLEVAALPRFQYVGNQGQLFRAFTAGNLAAISAAYDSALAHELPPDVKADFEKQRTASEEALRQALAAVDRVRTSSEEEPIGPVSLEENAPVATLSLEALELADRLVAGFLMANRAGVWQRSGAASARPAQYGRVGLSTQALTGDLFEDAGSWLKKLTLDDPLEVTRKAQELGEAVFIAGTVVSIGIAVTAGTAAALPVAVISAVAVSALTLVPAAIATALHTGASMLDAQQQVVPTASPTLLSMMNGLKTNVSSTLNKLKSGAMAFSKAGSKFGKALGNVVTSASSWTSNSATSSFSWLKTCVSNPKKCNATDAGVADSGTDGGNGPTSDGGMDGGMQEPIVGECGQQQVAGNDTPQTFVFDVGTACGELTLAYNMYGLKDRVTVTYEGTTVADSGCAADTGTLQVTFCGQSSTELTVQVEPNCDQTTGTAWNFTLNCPAK